MGKAERTKQFIIEQAAPIFNQKGIAGTSIDDVLQATKVAKGCLYGHFENKEALSYDVVDYLLGRSAARIGTILDTGDSAKSKLFLYLDLYKDPVSFATGGCPILNFGVESDDTNPIIKQKVKLVIQRAITRITSLIEEGITQGEFGAEFNAAEFALKTFTLIEGSMMISRVLGTNDHILALIAMLKKEIESYETK